MCSKNNCVLRLVFSLIIWSLFSTALTIAVIPAIAEAQPYKIGVIVGLTGGGAGTGQPVWKGAQMAIEQFNSKGGISGHLLQGIPEDSQWKPDSAVAGLKKLINIEHVQAYIIGGSAALHACAPMATQEKVTVTNSGAISPRLAGISPYVFHVTPLANYDIQVISRYAYKELGLRRMAITYINDENGRYNKVTFDKDFTALGGKIVAAESFEQNATDFGVQLAKVRYQNPEGIYLACSPTEAPFIVKQAREMGIKVPFFSWTTVETQEMLTIAGKAAEGVFYTSILLDPESTKEPVASFVKSYKARWNEVPNIYSAFGYDCIVVLAEGIKLGGYNGEAIANAIRKIRTFEGIGGTTTFREDGTCIKPLSLKTIQNGKFVLLRALKAEE